MTPNVTLSALLTEGDRKVSGTLFFGAGVADQSTYPVESNPRAGIPALSGSCVASGSGGINGGNGDDDGTATVSGTVTRNAAAVTIRTPEVLGSSDQEDDEITVSLFKGFPVLSLSLADGSVYPMIRVSASTVRFYDGASENCADS
ncbi:MAG: hypothetical protein ACRD0Z_16675 [Acidimicrobiales bacterium]